MAAACVCTTTTLFSVLWCGLYFSVLTVCVWPSSGGSLFNSVFHGMAAVVVAVVKMAAGLAAGRRYGLFNDFGSSVWWGIQ